MRLHPDIRFERLSIGAEKAPLLVIENFVLVKDEQHPESLHDAERYRARSAPD